MFHGLALSPPESIHRIVVCQRESFTPHESASVTSPVGFSVPSGRRECVKIGFI